MRAHWWSVDGSPAAKSHFLAGMQTFRRWLPELVSAGGFLRGAIVPLSIGRAQLDSGCVVVRERRALRRLRGSAFPGELLASNVAGPEDAVLASIGVAGLHRGRLARHGPGAVDQQACAALSPALASARRACRPASEWWMTGFALRTAPQPSSVISRRGGCPKNSRRMASYNDFTSFAWLHDDIDILVDPGTIPLHSGRSIVERQPRRRCA